MSGSSLALVLVVSKPKLYWAVWYWYDPKPRGESGEAQWCHHGSYDTKDDAIVEEYYCQRQGEQTELRRQDW